MLVSLFLFFSSYHSHNVWINLFKRKDNNNKTRLDFATEYEKKDKVLYKPVILRLNSTSTDHMNDKKYAGTKIKSSNNIIYLKNCKTQK